jgi:NADPH:quinone reductase-like Zn-dependent oxidoreductase
MQAIVYTKYGSPEVLHLKEVEKPTPKDDEVLVKVHAVSTSPADWHFMRGKPYPARIESGFPNPKNPILGIDIAGRVEAVGSKITDFKPGDEVFGDTFASGLGGFAEYVRAPQETLVPKPANLSFEEASTVSVSAITALQGLRNSGKIQAGDKVLINGASGGVGTFAVQIAKSFGAEVTGVTSTRNLDMVRSIGADHVIDYTQEDFTQSGQTYDLILDTVGNISVAGIERALKPGGRGVVSGFTTIPHLLGVMLKGGMASRRSDKKIAMMPTASPNKQDLLVLKELLETGKIKPVIDRCYPFSQTAEAVGYVEEGHARGKVVIIVEPDATA